MVTINNHINGIATPPVNGRYIDDINPATGKLFAQVASSDAADVELAVQAAKKAFPSWSAMPPEQRFNILNGIAERILQKLDVLAEAESLDSGKTVKTARTIDIPRSALNFRFFATALLHFASESHYTQGQSLSVTLRQPLGVVGCISPWNLPLYLFTWKIAPALAAGNCVIGKPSEVTPYTASLLAEICQEAGLPPGVLTILHGLGHEVGAAIVAHPEIKAISFTGSTRAGAEIARVAAPMFKKLSLELGGKNPNLIFADCNYEEMLATTVRSSFNNQGQICLCGSRIYVEASIYERFKQDFVSRVSALKVGFPTDDNSDLGAVVSQTHYHKILERIDIARQEGGIILCGGTQVEVEGEGSKGYYIAPTVIEGLPLNCRTNQEEIFGPVVTIHPFSTEEEALNLANGTPYGLSATVWTNNLSRAQRFSVELEAGIVWLNTWMMRDLRTPFGGVKDSGIGREGGWEALRFFTDTKNITFRL